MKSHQPILEIIEEEYEIPHLEAKRKISALLPYDYYKSDKKYPVLYLQDGQNLFNPEAPYGHWAVDHAMGTLARNGFGDLIIVAIDHGEEERVKEYLPYYSTEFGEGMGRNYIQFLKQKLIPYINKKYRVETSYDKVGIGGSSMGGLISLFAGLSEPEVFGKMLIFSPSLWISNMIFHHATVFEPLSESKIYLYAGGQESRSHLPNVRKLESILRKKAFADSLFDFELSVNMEGKHKEHYWAEEFPDAVKWLYFNK